GIGYSSILDRYRRKDSKIEDIVSDLPAGQAGMFLRGVSTRKINKITNLMWGSDVSAAEAEQSHLPKKKGEYARIPPYDYITYYLEKAMTLLPESPSETCKTQDACAKE
ncbi:MAG: hypothetical protein DRH15_09125, partial [Deltaproteobacteria bacterium]